jgi:hypothetical protein
LDIGPGSRIQKKDTTDQDTGATRNLKQEHRTITRPDLREYVMETPLRDLMQSLGLNQETGIEEVDDEYHDLRYREDDYDPDREEDDPSDADSDWTEPHDFYDHDQGLPEIPVGSPPVRGLAEDNPADLSILGEIPNLYVEVLWDLWDQAASPNAYISHIDIKRRSLRRLGELIRDKIISAGQLYLQQDNVHDALLMLAVTAKEVYAALAEQSYTAETYATRLAKSSRISLPRFGIVSFSEFLECCSGRREYEAKLVREVIHMLVQSEYRPNPRTQKQLANKLCKTDTWIQFWKSKGLADDQAEHRISIDPPPTITSRQVGNILAEMGYFTRASRRRKAGPATKDSLP